MRHPKRVLILLLVLLLVAGVTTWERLRVRDWDRALKVAIYPIAMDQASAAYVQQLEVGDFQEIAAFLTTEARRWRDKRVLAPQLVLKAPIRELPPLERATSGLEAIMYSLRLRWYAFRQTPFWESLGTVRLFVLYHELRFNESLPHSLGLQRGLLGVVHVFAADEQRAQNHIVITHELLHTFGARDKYDAHGRPVYPAGYAEFTAQPLHPQHKAEIMAGRIPLSATEAVMPASLEQTAIGYATAAEIGW